MSLMLKSLLPKNLLNEKSLTEESPNPRTSIGLMDASVGKDLQVPVG